MLNTFNQAQCIYKYKNTHHLGPELFFIPGESG